MPGAKPTISRPASIDPKDRTGALFQSGYLPCSSWRNATRRGQSGQSSGGSSNGDATVDATVRSSRTDHLAGTLLARHVAGAGGARRALGRIAGDQRCELGQLDEVVGLAAQLV